MIEIENLSYAYKKQPSLFSGLSMKEDSGRILGLLGKNGAGKTTLLHLITGLLAPSSGKISVAGYNAADRNPNLLEQIHLVPEEFEFPSVSGNCYIKAMSPLYPRFDKKKMAELLIKFNLSADRKLTKLSMGQKKKFRIAFALATCCQLIVLDEPTNGLDIPSKAIFRQIMASSLLDDQLVIISTHQVKDVESLIDKIVLVDDGKVIFNQDMLSLSEKYEFASIPVLTNDVLYSEQCITGYRIIRPSVGISSEVDIELLFNAINSGVNLN